MRFRRSDIGSSLAGGAAACVMAMTALTCGGCASGTAPPTGAAELIEVGACALGAATAEDVRAGDRSRTTFAGWGADSSSRLVVEREPNGKGGAGAYIQRRWLTDRDRRTLIREQFLAVREDGAVVLAEEINHAEGVEVVFTPPLVVLPTRIEDQARTTHEGRMTVHPLGDRSRTRAKGTVKNTVVCGGAVRVRTPAGEFDAWRLTSVMDADLSPSRVHNETDLWLVPGLGMIAERRRERTTVLGVSVRNNSEAWVVIEAPPAGNGPR